MPGLVRTTDGEVRVYSDEEAAELLGCLEEDVARWIGFGLVDYVPVGRGQLCITHDEVMYLRKLAKHPTYKDWLYDRLLWKRYELAYEQREQRRRTGEREERQEPLKVRRRQQAWGYEDYGATTERDFAEYDDEVEDDPRQWRQSMGLPQQRQLVKRSYGAGERRRR